MRKGNARGRVASCLYPDLLCAWGEGQAVNANACKRLLDGKGKEIFAESEKRSSYSISPA